ncbi:MAG: MarR family transcriptional regulator [Asgard group archaeon]|nr:MarR family transcriptional regulator [Asgard group archaeon]
MCEEEKLKSNNLILKVNLILIISTLTIIQLTLFTTSTFPQEEFLFNEQKSLSEFNCPVDNSLTTLFKPLQSLNPNLTRIIYDIYFNVNSNGDDVSISTDFTYQNIGSTDVYYIMHLIDITTILADSRISTIDVYDTFGNLAYQWDIIGNINQLNISLREPIHDSDFYSFTIDYLLEHAIIKNNDIYQSSFLQWSITHDDDIEQFSLILILPAKFILYNQSAVDPEPDYKSVDDRRLEWYFYNIFADQTQTWIIRFNIYETSIQTPEPYGKGFWLSLIGTFVGGFIFGGLAVFFILKSRTDIERKEIVETLLSSPEKEILRIIKSQNGVTTQSKITSESGFSKAKVSYYLTELENKEIIARERWGRMNRIRIIDDSVDKVYFSGESKENITE